MTINLENIEELTFDENLFDIQLEGKSLIINSKINGEIIDSNFNELDNRITNIESQLRLRINGQLQKLAAELNTTQNEVMQLKLKKDNAKKKEKDE